MKTSDRSYARIAQQYCSDVLTGRIPACKWVRLACKRQVEDLKRYPSKDCAFWFDEAEAGRVCRFIELLPHTKGELRGQRIRLDPWQVFILSAVFGWKSHDGHRRFRRAYVEVPRGNGKSTLLSGIGLYCLLADREPGAEVYSFATTRDQAKIVWGDAKEMARMSEPLQHQFGLEVLANSLYVPGTNSTFQAKSAEGSTLDGLNTHLAIIDELHAHKTRAVYDVVETSLGKRRNSLLFVITTAGFDLSGICYEVRSMVTGLLQGTATDERQFGIIYSIDDGDDWRTEAALVKANPNWNVSVRPEVISGLQQKAMLLSSAQNNFLTKHLDVWCNANSAWMDMSAWDACADTSLKPDDFAGEPCFIGLDLASKRDLAAKVLLFPKVENGKTHVYCFGQYYLPESAVAESPNSQMKGWAELGIVKASPGATTDYGEILEDLRMDCATYDVQKIAYDPWQSTPIVLKLDEEGAPLSEVRQTVQNLSEPMKELEAMVLDGRLHHNGDPAMRWMMSNVVAHIDAKDNIYPRKDRYEQKIDGPVAMIIGLSRVLADRKNESGADFSEFLADPLVLNYV